MRYALPGLIILHAASSLHAYPNYLSYANEFWGGPREAYKYQAWLDGGQAYLEAKSYLERHPTENCWLVTGWQWDPRLYDIPCRTFGLYVTNQVPPQVHGTVIVSSTLLTDVRLPEGEFASPFKKLTPREKIGGSALLVFEGDFDTKLAAAKSERELMVQAYSVGEPGTALLHGRRSVELAPESALAHGQLCELQALMGQLEAALSECDRAQKILLRDPLREEPLRKKSLAWIEGELGRLRSEYKAAYGQDAVIASSMTESGATGSGSK